MIDCCVRVDGAAKMCLRCCCPKTLNSAPQLARTVQISQEKSLPMMKCACVCLVEPFTCGATQKLSRGAQEDKFAQVEGDEKQCDDDGQTEHWRATQFARQLFGVLQRYARVQREKIVIRWCK